MAKTRGNLITLPVTFRDAAGAAVAVTSATMNVSYPLGFTFVDEELTLVEGSANQWSGEWDSGVSDPGQVYWSAEGLLAGDPYVQDGSFRLTANRANERDA